ncbi:MAG: thioredoxin family protein [Cellulophaga sp.]|nr:thioredoxin family protein [Cellulophaga sp.]
MKHLILGITFLFVITSYGQNWYKNFEEAQKESTTSNKTLILVFSGSDWCAPCIKLDKDIWQSSEFINYAAEHYILYKADFPRRKGNQLSEEIVVENKNLAEKYNTKGYFPLVLVLNKKGEILGETGYQKVTPKAYISTLNSFKD